MIEINQLRLSATQPRVAQPHRYASQCSGKVIAVDIGAWRLFPMHQKPRS
jgi:hypothetical protein